MVPECLLLICGLLDGTKVLGNSMVCQLLGKVVIGIVCALQWTEIVLGLNCACPGRLWWFPARDMSVRHKQPTGKNILKVQQWSQ